MIFDRLTEGRSLENPAVPLTQQNLHEYIGDGDSAAGVSVTPHTVMRLQAVYSCVYILGSSIGQLPLGVLRKQGDRIEVATDHPAYYLLHDAPNEWQTSYKWRETTQALLPLEGNGYGRIVRSRRGELQAIEFHHPRVTSLGKSERTGRWVYATEDEDGTPFAVPPEDMLHLRALGSSGRMGTGLIRQAKESFGLALSAQRYGKQFFDGGGRPTGLVMLKDNTLKEDGWTRLKDVWRKAAGALRQSENKTLLLPAGLDYKAITVTPEEAQFLETRKMNRSEIAGLFNVPAHMINDLDKATFSNISEQAIQFVRHTVMPWVVNWEQELNRRLFTAAERRAGYYVKFNLAGLLRGTPTERAQFYHYAITDGWMDRNEVRALEDLNPRDGLGEMLISVNAKTLNEIKQPPALPAE